MELGLVPLVDRVMSKGVFRGAVASGKLGSLPAGWWGCVAALLVGCPKASWHWSLQTVVWGQVLVPKWQPPGEFMPVSTLQSSTTSVLDPALGHSQPPPTPGCRPNPVDRSGSGSCGVIALPWVPLHMKPCVCPPSVESLFFSVQ